MSTRDADTPGEANQMAIMNRLAGAPISWGVCEVPGWGLELPRERVLGEMQQLGLSATELGSDGYLPSDPAELKDLCQEYDLTLIGGFVPVVIHEPTQIDATIEATHRAAKLMSAAGGTILVSCPVTDWKWGPRQELTQADWQHSSKMLHVIDDIVAEYGMTQAMHPHLRTIVETRDDVKRILELSDVGWTFDTGHMQIGGLDPLEFLDDAFDRIRHVHLKDVVIELAGPVFRGEQSIMEGVQAGMFSNLGQGDVPIAEIVQQLEVRGYDQWYVLEQDAAITTGEPDVGSGPILDVLTSIEFLSAIETSASVA